MEAERRSIRTMPYRRRHNGLSALSVFRRDKWIQLSALFFSLSTIIQSVNLKYVFVLLGIKIALYIQKISTYIRNAVDPVDPYFKNRNIASFSDEFCYRHLRFRKDQLIKIYNLVNFPNQFILDNNCKCPGEYAFCIMLYRLHYPTTLSMMQSTFGREYSQLSRIFNAAINYMYEHHRHRVTDIEWYSPRFDFYNKVIQKKISKAQPNQHPGTVPGHLQHVFGFIDGSYRRICKVQVSINILLAYTLLYL